MKIALPFPFTLKQHENGFGCYHENQLITTKIGNPLIVPSKKLAQKIESEAEYIAQQIKNKQQKLSEKTAPANLPANDSAPKHPLKNPPALNCPITARVFEIIDHIAPYQNIITIIEQDFTRYGMNDLLCYRAENHPQLTALENQSWQKWLDWAADEYRIKLIVTEGIIQIPQDPDSEKKLYALIASKPIFERAPLTELAKILGSAILALGAGTHPHLANEIFASSMLHEDFQAQKWGATQEYQKARAGSETLFAEILDFYLLSKN